MLKMLLIGGLAAGGLTIGFGFAGVVTIDGHEYHVGGDPAATTVTSTVTSTPVPYYCGQYPSGTGCPEITPTTTYQPPTPSPDWKQYCATHVDSTECDNAPPLSAPTTTTAASERHCGTGIPAGCIDPTPTDIANATQACADVRANPTDGGVELVTNRLLDPYGRDAATGLIRYATVTICPDMAPAVAREWNNRMARIGESADWDSLWKETP